MRNLHRERFIKAAASLIRPRKVLADAKVRSDKPAPKPYKLVATHRLFRLVPPQRWQAVALSEGHDPSVAKRLQIETGRQTLEKIAHQRHESTTAGSDVRRVGKEVVGTCRSRG